MSYQIGLTVVLALSLALSGFTLAIVSSGYQHKLVRGSVLVIFILNLVALCFVVIAKFNPRVGISVSAAIQEQAPASPTTTTVPTPVVMAPAPIIPTPTAVPEEEAAPEFGGVLIKNPSGQWLSIQMWDQDKNMYVPYIMTNGLGEEVKKNKDKEYFLEAADAQTYFEGYVQVGDQKYDFVFDSEKDGKSVKEIKI